jgi:hypothetical protein
MLSLSLKLYEVGRRIMMEDRKKKDNYFVAKKIIKIA